jgi:hypothetical protein
MHKCVLLHAEVPWGVKTCPIHYSHANEHVTFKANLPHTIT